MCLDISISILTKHWWLKRSRIYFNFQSFRMNILVSSIIIYLTKYITYFRSRDNDGFWNSNYIGEHNNVVVWKLLDSPVWPQYFKYHLHVVVCGNVICIDCFIVQCINLCSSIAILKHCISTDIQLIDLMTHNGEHQTHNLADYCFWNATRICFISLVHSLFGFFISHAC